MKIKKYVAINADDLNGMFENSICALSEQLEGSEREGQISETVVLDMPNTWKRYNEEEYYKEFVDGLKSLHKFMMKEKIDYILY
jgi:hypothetical protein